MNVEKTELFLKHEVIEPEYSSEELLSIFSPNETGQYNMNEIIARLIDGSEFNEYKKDYGKTIICGNAKISGRRVGIVANQKINVKTKLNEIQMGGVIYSDSADKAA